MAYNHNLLPGFHFVCLVLTFSLLVYCACKYIKDESISLVDFQTYHSRKEDIYPTITICLDNSMFPSFDTNNLKMYNATKAISDKLNEKYHIDDINKLRDYVRFLRADEADRNTILGIDQILNVEYDDITINLDEYVKSIAVEGGSNVLYHWSTNYKTPFYVSYRHAMVKCFSLDISEDVMPNITGNVLSKVQIELFSNITIEGAGMAYLMHYPKQLMRTASMGYSDLLREGCVVTKTFRITSMEVIRRRNTRASPCNKDYNEEDDWIRRKLVEKGRCNPPHWPTYANFPKCSTIKQMRETITPQQNPDAEFLKPFNPPCNQIQSISYTSKDVEDTQCMVKMGPEKTKNIIIDLPNPYYKQIEHVQSFDIESVIGVMGGYVGLFLGCAIWEAPDLIQFMIGKFKSIVDILTKKMKK